MMAHWPIPAGWWDRAARRARHAGRDLLEQLQPFRAQAVFELGEAGDVAAWPRDALDETGADRIDGLREHDRHRAGGLPHGSHDVAAGSQDHVRGERGQFRGVAAPALGVAAGPADVDAQVAADDPARLLQALLERREACLPFRIVGGGVYENADATHALLRARGKRHRGRPAKHRKKFTPTTHVFCPLKRTTLFSFAKRR